MASREPQPLVILGLDVGDPRLIEQMVREGTLPNIRSLIDRGMWGRIGGPEMLCEHGIWTGIFSGLSRRQHGYHYFRQLQPRSYTLQAIKGPDVPAPSFWEHLKQSGKSVAIIDPPDVDPVLGLPGSQISHWAVHDPQSPSLSEPLELLPDLAREFGPQTIITENLNSTYEEDVEIYRQLLSRIERKGKLCRHILAKRDYQLVIAVFAETHTGTHQFWRYRPEANAEEPGALGNAIRNIYEQIDEQIGLLIRAVPANANVCLLGGTGMDDHYPTGGLVEDFCSKLGYHVTWQPAKSSFNAKALFRRIVPERLRVGLSRYLSRETRERLLSDTFRNGTDWKRTTAFAIPSPYTAFIRINLVGREPEGIVPREQYDQTLTRLEADLHELIDPATGDAAVLNVSRTTEVFKCEPHESLPDLFVEFKPLDRFLESLVHPKATLTQTRPEFFRSSDHSHEGFFAMAGPAIPQMGNVGVIDLLDVAPTCLSLLEWPIPRDMPGRPIFECQASALAGQIQVAKGKRNPVVLKSPTLTRSEKEA